MHSLVGEAKVKCVSYAQQTRAELAHATYWMH